MELLHQDFVMWSRRRDVITQRHDMAEQTSFYTENIIFRKSHGVIILISLMIKNTTLKTAYSGSDWLAKPARENLVRPAHIIEQKHQLITIFR